MPNIFEAITGDSVTRPGVYFVNPIYEDKLNIPKGVGKYLMASLDGIYTTSEEKRIVEFKYTKDFNILDSSERKLPNYNKLQLYMGITGIHKATILAVLNQYNLQVFQNMDYELLTSNDYKVLKETTKVIEYEFDPNYWKKMMNWISVCVDKLYEPFIDYIKFSDKMQKIEIPVPILK
jgi:hypothetical protein